MPWEIAPEIVSAIISGLISGFISSAVAMMIFYFKWLASLDKRVTSLETKIEPFWEGVMKVISTKILGANPASTEGIKNLLKKFEAGTLGHEEAKELKVILEEELKKARKKKDDPLVVNLTILLSTLDVIIERTSPKEVTTKAK